MGVMTRPVAYLSSRQDCHSPFLLQVEFPWITEVPLVEGTAHIYK